MNNKIILAVTVKDLGEMFTIDTKSNKININKSQVKALIREVLEEIKSEEETAGKPKEENSVVEGTDSSLESVSSENDTRASDEDKDQSESNLEGVVEETITTPKEDSEEATEQVVSNNAEVPEETSTVTEVSQEESAKETAETANVQNAEQEEPSPEFLPVTEET